MGDIGGEDGGKGLEVRCRSGGSSDIICVNGDSGISEIEEAVEGRRHSTGERG